MAGSKKGEKRGGAKGKRHWTPNPNIASANLAGRPKGSKNKPKVAIDHEVMQILNSRRTEVAKERLLQDYFLVTGQSDRMPKEIMFSASRHFEQTAVAYYDVMQANLASAAAARTPQEREMYNNAALEAESRVKDNLLLAVDVAYKGAPYSHARLSAIMTNPGSGDSHVTILATLLRDLDEAGRPARYIDHEPNIEGNSKQDLQIVPK